MPCFSMEAAPRTFMHPRSIASVTSYRLVQCWRYSREIETQVGSNHRLSKPVIFFEHGRPPAPPSAMNSPHLTQSPRRRGRAACAAGRARAPLAVFEVDHQLELGRSWA